MNQIIDHINSQPRSYAFRINTMGTYNEALGRFIHSGSTLGVSDIIAIYQGRFIALEVKQGQDRMNPKQKKFADRVIASLANYYEIRSFDQLLKTWKGVTESIDAYDNAAIEGLKQSIVKPPFA